MADFQIGDLVRMPGNQLGIVSELVHHRELGKEYAILRRPATDVIMGGWWLHDLTLVDRPRRDFAEDAAYYAAVTE